MWCSYTGASHLYCIVVELIAGDVQRGQVPVPLQSFCQLQGKAQSLHVSCRFSPSAHGANCVPWWVANNAEDTGMHAECQLKKAFVAFARRHKHCMQRMCELANRAQDGGHQSSILGWLIQL